MAKSGHTWTFLRAGGVDQVVLRTGDDLEHLDELDQKLWAALACPTSGTEIEERTLDLVDSDDDGRIRPPEILGAVAWCSKIFDDLDVLFEAGDSLKLDAFNEETEEGQAALASAKRILEDGGKPDAEEVSLADVLAMEKLFVATRFNGDGIVPADSADDETTQKAIVDIITAVGSAVDRSGKPGVDQKLVDTFFAEAQALLDWHAQGSSDDIRVIGDKTADAATAHLRVAEKVDDYFTRCRLAAFDARGAATLNAPEAELLALATHSLSAGSDEVAHLPVSRIEAGRALPLEASVNPAWAPHLLRFSEATLTPLLGGSRTSLTEADWATVKKKLGPYLDWWAKRIETGAGVLGVARVEELVRAETKKTIDALIEKDASLQAAYAQIASVEKAVRFRLELVRLLRNFVNFSDFYSGKGASFQAGRLFFDARTCDLCIFVNDAGKHAALAGLSSAYLAYCDCTRLSGEKKSIVAAFTAGDTDDLLVGRNGVFYDRKGRDWDATITSIIENPISVRQAFWTPYKKLIRLVEEQVAKRAAEKEKAANAHIEGTAAAAGTVGAAPPAPAAVVVAAPPAEPEKKFDVGMLAAIGLVVTGVATFLSSVLATFLGLGMWMPLGIIALLLAISGPSMLIAWLKLRRRSLGPILDANGWAVNTRARINVKFGTSLTSLATLPEGSERSLTDPYAEEPSRWRLYLALVIIIALALAWFFGTVDRFLPDRARANVVLHRSPLTNTAAPTSSASPIAAPTSAAPAASAAPAK